MFMGICRTDGTFLDANRLAYEACGFGPETETGRRFWSTGWWAGRPEVSRRVETWCRQVGAGGPPVRAITAYFLADGTERLVDFTLHLVADGEGREYLLASGMDVTERVEQERVAAELHELQGVQAQLNRALQRSARILDNVADGLYGLDVHGRVEFANPAATAITGHPVDELLGSDQHALIHARHADGNPYPVEQCPVWLALRQGRTVVAEHEVFWHADGRPVPVELIAVPTMEDGAVSGVVVSFRDLTARLEARRQAEELRRVSEQAAAQRALSDRLQAALLTPPPRTGDLEIAVRYQPAVHDAQIGGDWYDAFVQPDRSTVLVVGDVVGHDNDAAAAMGQLRGLLRALAYDSAESPATILSRVERAAAGLAVSTMATAALARIQPSPDRAGGGRELCWSSAGHLPPLLLRADGTSTLLETPPDLMLGVHGGAQRHDHRVDLPDDATVLLFTDGLVERRGADLDAGLDALRTSVTDLGTAPLEQLCDTVLTRVVPHPGDDDVALIAVRGRPAG